MKELFFLLICQILAYASPVDECSFKIEGIPFSHESNCKLFHMCINGYKHNLECMDNEHFNPDLGYCLKEDKADCSLNKDNLEEEEIYEVENHPDDLPITEPTVPDYDRSETTIQDADSLTTIVDELETPTEIPTDEPSTSSFVDITTTNIPEITTQDADSSTTIVDEPEIPTESTEIPTDEPYTSSVVDTTTTSIPETTTQDAEFSTTIVDEPEIPTESTEIPTDEPVTSSAVDITTTNNPETTTSEAQSSTTTVHEPEIPTELTEIPTDEPTTTPESEITTQDTEFSTDLQTTLKDDSTAEPFITTPEIKTTRKNPIFPTSCFGQRLGKVIYYDGDCTKFIVCIGNGMVENCTPPKLHFNAALGVCDWPERANCPWA